MIVSVMEAKLEKYTSQDEYKPFHHGLMGEEVMDGYSFIHSINTSMGTSIFETVAKEIAKDYFDVVELKKKMQGGVNDRAMKVIKDIMSDVQGKRLVPDATSEIQKLHEAISQQSCDVTSISPAKADIYLEKGNTIYLIDIKTVKPNKTSIHSLKEQLLQWAALALSENPDRNIVPMIGIPYNPFHPEEYNWLEMYNTLERERQVKIGSEFWNFLAGGDNIYNDLVKCFQDAGEIVRPKLVERYGISEIKHVLHNQLEKLLREGSDLFDESGNTTISKVKNFMSKL